MYVLWLRYLTEINGKTREIPQELLDNPEIKKAVTLLEESAFSDAQLLGYDDFWDAVRVEQTLVSDALQKGKQEGIQEGMKQGMKQGIQEGMKQGIQEGMKQGERNKEVQIAKKLKAMGMETTLIIQATGAYSR